MPSAFIEIAYAQVQHLQPGDIVRFMDPDDSASKAAQTVAWLVVVAVSSGTALGTHQLELTSDTQNRIRVIRRSWAAVQVQVRITSGKPDEQGFPRQTEKWVLK